MRLAKQVVNRIVVMGSEELEAGASAWRAMSGAESYDVTYKASADDAFRI